MGKTIGPRWTGYRQRLAELDRVEVVARVSQSGDATARSGDLQGTATVAPEAEGIRVVIDRVLP
ncbi:hypothetical protein SAMN05421721_101226 [Ectothiorhodospira mobilis]|uniref:Cytochrome c-type biogenesis protein H Ig-like domain-containing protein n=1 Tax=Ectothiorhodospira mobilis TaxID=195064 RepID=A0A1I4PFE0_ECTMO|nr:hypothetical protein [Ectothiorhodospira mobilis]SFM26236.1 hypothetical protein SAMN05421721_101226 [Ectothiorhodospira mobilis]